LCFLDGLGQRGAAGIQTRRDLGLGSVSTQAHVQGLTPPGSPHYSGSECVVSSVTNGLISPNDGNTPFPSISPFAARQPA